jgi:hypothetical protein
MIQGNPDFIKLKSHQNSLVLNENSIADLMKKDHSCNSYRNTNFKKRCTTQTLAHTRGIISLRGGVSMPLDRSHLP